MTRVAFWDSLAKPVFSKALNQHNLPRGNMPSSAKPPQIHMHYIIFFITFSKIVLMKDGL
jgi:hypothetical protein